ncbi:MAG: DNA methyltransferase [Acidimicrobiales bacterium]
MLKLGRWTDVLDGVWCDTLISDPPYGESTHKGHGRVGTLSADCAERKTLPYGAWSSGDVDVFVDSWSPRVRGWFCCLTSHDLYPAYRAALERNGRYVFAPVPCVIRGMSVRLQGDGPSSWTVWLVVARPRNKTFAGWGTLPGAYIVSRGSGDGASQMTGGKPLELMLGIVRDYSKAGDVVCDPCAGMATTGVASLSLGRQFVGSEIDPATHARAADRLACPVQQDMFL